MGDIYKEKKKFSLRQKISLVMLASADFLCSSAMSVMAPFYPKEAYNKGVSETVSGLVFSFYSFIIFVSSPIFGKIIPKIGVTRCFTVGILVSGLCCIIFGTLKYVHEYSFFTTLSFTIRGIEAMGSSAYCTASYVLVNNIFPDDAGYVRGVLEIFVGLGLTAGPAIGGLLFAVGGFELPFYVMGIVIILLAPMNIFLIRQNSIDKERKCGSLKNMLKIPSVILACLIIVVVSISWSFFDPILEPHLRIYDLSPTNVGLCFLLMSTTYGICSPIFGWLGDNFECYYLLMAGGMFLSGISLMFLGPSNLLIYIFQSNLNALWREIISLAFLGIFVAATLLPTYRALLDGAIGDGGFEDNISTQGLVAGLWSSVYSLGEVIGPVSGAAIFEKFGYSVTMDAIAVMNIITSIFTLGYYFYKKEKDDVVLLPGKITSINDGEDIAIWTSGFDNNNETYHQMGA